MECPVAGPAESDATIGRTFRSDGLERRLFEQGYVVVDLMTPAEARPLGDEFLADFAHRGAGFEASMDLPDIESRLAVHERLSELWKPRLDALLVGHDIVISSLLVKWPGPGSQKDLHQDWSLTDEERHRAIGVWVPFVDVDATNGALSVLPGSHDLLRHVRPGPVQLPGVPDPISDLRFRDLELLTMRAGEAVIYDLALVHGSDQNRTTVPRPVAGMSLIPRNAQLYFYFNHGDHIVRHPLPGPESLLRMIWNDGTPNLPPGERVEEPRVVLTADDLRRSCSVAHVPITGPSIRGIRWPDIARRLERDGYAELGTVLGPDECRRLEESFDRAMAAAGLDIGSTWFPTALLPDRTAREAIRSVTQAVLEPHLPDIFDLEVIELLTADLVVKPTGPSSELGLHQDFSIVDEVTSTSYFLWIPLSDTDAQNGTLEIVPGSHRFANRIRARHVPALFREVEQELLDVSVRLDCRAGEGVIMAAGVIHFSRPNGSNRRRLAAHASLKPYDAPLLFFFADDETPSDRVEAFETDMDGYLELVQGERPPPPYVPVRTYARPPEQLSIERLRAGLTAADGQWTRVVETTAPARAEVEPTVREGDQGRLRLLVRRLQDVAKRR